MVKEQYKLTKTTRDVRTVYPGQLGQTQVDKSKSHQQLKKIVFKKFGSGAMAQWEKRWPHRPEDLSSDPSTG